MKKKEKCKKNGIKNSRNPGVPTCSFHCCSFCCGFNVNKGNQLLPTPCILGQNIVENGAVFFLMQPHRWHTVCPIK